MTWAAYQVTLLTTLLLEGWVLIGLDTEISVWQDQPPNQLAVELRESEVLRRKRLACC